MQALRARVPILALALLIVVAALALSIGNIGAQSVSTPLGDSPQLPPIFAAHGPSNQPGAWLWSPTTGIWTFTPARAYQGGATLPAGETPARPQDVAVLWVATTDRPNTFWVWNTFKFAISDAGYSSWIPEWQLVEGLDFLER